MWAGVLYLLRQGIYLLIFCYLGFDADSFFEVVPFIMAHYLVKYLTVI